MVVKIAECQTQTEWVVLRKRGDMFNVLASDREDARVYKSKPPALHRFKQVVARITSRAIKGVK